MNEKPITESQNNPFTLSGTSPPVPTMDEDLGTLNAEHISGTIKDLMTSNTQTHIPTLQKYRVCYYLKRPKPKGRTTFAIYCKQTAPGGKVISQSPVELESVAAINLQYTSRSMGFADANLQVEKIKNQLNSESKKRSGGVYVATESNLKLAQEYWQNKYRRRKLKSRDSQYRLILQAVRSIAHHPLLGSAGPLQEQVDCRFKRNPNRQRAIAAKLNQMRKWFGINQDSLALEKKRKCEVKHVNNEEFNKIINYVRPYHNKKFNQTVPAEVLRDFYRVCYASGARQSEGFAMRTESLKGNAVFIDSQIRRNEKFKSSTKTGKARRAIFFEDASESLHRWSEFSGKVWIERSSLARNLKNASKKAFPNQPEKWICVHDLRHSYAIRLIREYEFSLTQTAMFLGNSVVVCEDYYANFVMSDENIESLYRAKVKKTK